MSIRRVRVSFRRLAAMVVEEKRLEDPPYELPEDVKVVDVYCSQLHAQEGFCMLALESASFLDVPDAQADLNLFD